MNKIGLILSKKLLTAVVLLVSLTEMANADGFHRALRLAIYADQNAYYGMYPGKVGSDGAVVGLHRISLTASTPFNPCKFEIFSSIEVNQKRIMTGLTAFDLRNDSTSLVSGFERERWISYTETKGFPMATPTNSPSILEHFGKGAFDGYFVLPSENKNGVSIIDAFKNLASSCRE